MSENRFGTLLCSVCQKVCDSLHNLGGHFLLHEPQNRHIFNQDAQNQIEGPNPPAAPGEEANINLLHAHQGEVEINNEEDNPVVPEPLSIKEELKKLAVDTLLELMSTSSLTGKAVERFEKGCFNMLQQFSLKVHENISNALSARGMELEEIGEVLKDLELKADPFDELRTIDEQLKYFHEHFGLVIPQSKFLGTRIDQRLDSRNNCFTQAQVNETLQYVSIIENLKLILSNKSIRAKIFKGKVSKDGVLRSYVDGSHFKDHPFLMQVSSRLSSIYLLVLAHADDLKKDGVMEKVLILLVREMKILSSEEGVDFEIDREKFKIRAVLVALTADNTGVWCMVNRQEIRADANAVGIPRTIETHKLHVAAVTANPRLRTEYDFVADRDEYHDLIFLLQDAIQIIFAFEVRPGDLDRLSIIIYQHHELFMKLFINKPQLPTENQEEEAVDDIAGIDEETIDDVPEEPAQNDQNKTKKKTWNVYVTNKVHQMTHLPEMMRKFGPAVRMWCGKFEGRMKIFRQHASICCNFQNPPKTMAAMFQLSTLKPIITEEEEFNVDYQSHGPKMVARDSIHGASLIRCGLSEDEPITYTNSATLNGEEYRPGLFVCLPDSVLTRPIFAIISDVIVTNKALFLVTKPWTNVGLSARYNAFKCVPQVFSEYKVLNVLSLTHFRCIAPWSVGLNDVYISMKTV
ncbi:BEACH domain-containing protein C2 [Frankliniella fusca]|uniref:BEACH domain-containing protein C2 n=1 Tax=Frankliniella fusca TaxID=407009 RepID=A0AAE1HNL6_9NEOP|nr:BEACH domain-containing protein C2 [Frankliniella fusca]